MIATQEPLNQIIVHWKKALIYQNNLKSFISTFLCPYTVTSTGIRTFFTTVFKSTNIVKTVSNVIFGGSLESP